MILSESLSSASLIVPYVLEVQHCQCSTRNRYQKGEMTDDPPKWVINISDVSFKFKNALKTLSEHRYI